MTNELINLVKYYEGFTAKPKPDVSGYSIGYGNHYYEDGTAVKANDPAIDVARGEKILNAALERMANQVAKIVDKTKLTTPQFEALVSLKYNCYGVNANSTLIKTINKTPNDPRIEALFGEWCKVGGKTLPGWVKRRKSEYIYYSTGKLNFSLSIASLAQAQQTTTQSSPSDAVSTNSVTQVMYYNTNYCGSQVCDIAQGAEVISQTNGKEVTSSNKPNTATVSYTTELQLGLSRAILLSNKKYTFYGPYYSTDIQGGHRLSGSITEPNKSGYTSQVVGRIQVDILHSKNRYKVQFTTEKGSKAREENIKEYNSIIKGTEVIGKNYNEALSQFEKIFGDTISKFLYDKFSGAKYEKLDGGELFNICAGEYPYTKEKLLNHMKTKKLDLVYLADRQSKGKDLITNPNKSRVVLRCGENNAITWIIDSNAGAGAGWVGFRLLQEGSGV